jgi:hypothetical protein
MGMLRKPPTRLQTNEFGKFVVEAEARSQNGPEKVPDTPETPEKA